MKTKTFLLGILFIASCSQRVDYRELFRQSKEKTKEGAYQEAIYDLDKVIAAQPDFDSAYVERAYNYLYLEEIPQAMKDARTAIELNPLNMGGYYMRGRIYDYLYRDDKAIQDYTFVIEQGDALYKHPALKERAYLYYNNDLVGKAIEDLSIILSEDSLDYEAYVSRGIVRADHDVYEEYAGQSLDSITVFLPDITLRDDFSRYFKLQVSSSGKTVLYDTKGAIEDFCRAIKLDSSFAFAYYSRAKVYGRLDLEEAALADINHALNLKEDNNYYLLRASIYKKTDKNNDALDDLNRAIELNPENGKAFLERGRLKRLLNDTIGAKEDFLKAKELGMLLNMDEFEMLGT